jgi:hypothetical protein
MDQFYSRELLCNNQRTIHREGNIMRSLWLAIVTMIVVGCMTGPVEAEDANALEMFITRSAGTYSINFAARKVGATTCHLMTPNGSYECDNYACGQPVDYFVGDELYLGDHEGMSYSGLQAAIATPWTLVWDQGDPGTETTVTINFGTVQESDFYSTPTLVNPQDGTVFVNPGPSPFTVEWEYSVAPCVAQVEDFGVTLIGPDCQEVSSDDLENQGCDVTSWTPSVSLAQGEWLVHVVNGNGNFREVPTGLTIMGDQWVLDNTGWLAVYSLAEHNITVPVRKASWGCVKAIYGQVPGR